PTIIASGVRRILRAGCAIWSWSKSPPVILPVILNEVKDDGKDLQSCDVEIPWFIQDGGDGAFTGPEGPRNEERREPTVVLERNLRCHDHRPNRRGITCAFCSYKSKIRDPKRR